jgi:hypothetical protein
MTTRIEIKNEGPNDVQVQYGSSEASKFILKPQEVNSVLYVYHEQEVVVREILKTQAV